jgi:hypothetical protein
LARRKSAKSNPASKIAMNAIVIATLRSRMLRGCEVVHPETPLGRQYLIDLDQVHTVEWKFHKKSLGQVEVVWILDEGWMALELLYWKH